MTISATRIGHVSGAFRDLPRMADPGTKGYIDDVFANPDGPRCAGYFELSADAPLDY